MTKDEEQLVNRTALLKEIVKTEKSRDWKRAEALLRSLGSGRRTFQGTINMEVRRLASKGTCGHLLLARMCNPISRSLWDVALKNMDATLSFGNTFPGDGGGMFSKPSKTGPRAMTPLKRAALGFMIGESVSRWPDQVNYRVDPTSKSRSRLYRMMSKGAFDAYEKNPYGMVGGGYEVAQGMRRGPDKFQPRDIKGRLKKQVQWNPKDLMKPLVQMAAGQGMKHVIKSVAGDPRAQLAIDLMQAADAGLTQATGKGFSGHYQDANLNFRNTGFMTTP